MHHNDKIVREAQIALHKLGYPIMMASGKYDEPTRLAVIAFQRCEMLPDHGMLDAATVARLRHRVNPSTGADAVAPGTPGTATTTTVVTTKPLTEKGEPMSMQTKTLLALLGAAVIGGGIYYLVRPSEKPKKKVERDNPPFALRQHGPPYVRALPRYVPPAGESEVLEAEIVS